MALKYVVKKRVFGFDKTKTEKYVAQNVITNTVNFRDLCKEVSMFGMIPEGAVKHVIDALIDALNTNLNKGLSVQLGDFGCFRPGMSCKSQKEEKDKRRNQHFGKRLSTFDFTTNRCSQPNI